MLSFLMVCDLNSCLILLYPKLVIAEVACLVGFNQKRLYRHSFLFGNSRFCSSLRNKNFRSRNDLLCLATMTFVIQDPTHMTSIRPRGSESLLDTSFNALSSCRFHFDLPLKVVTPRLRGIL